MTHSSQSITEAKVMRGLAAHVGSRVKHYGQRWTGCATATVIGFARAGDTRNALGFADDWIKVLVQPDEGDGGLYGTEWDWDRTEIAPDV